MSGGHCQTLFIKAPNSEAILRSTKLPLEGSPISRTAITLSITPGRCYYTPLCRYLYGLNNHLTGVCVKAPLRLTEQMPANSSYPATTLPATGHSAMWMEQKQQSGLFYYRAMSRNANACLKYPVKATRAHPFSHPSRFQRQRRPYRLPRDTQLRRGY